MQVNFFDSLVQECELYKNARGFLRLGIKSAVSELNQHDSEFVCKTSLLISYAGLLLLLKSVLKNSVVTDDDKKLILLERIDFKWYENKLCPVSNTGKTVNKDTLLKRLKEQGFPVSSIENPVREIAAARNDIEHSFSSKSKEELASLSLKIFHVTNEIIIEREDFWEKPLLDELIKLDKITKPWEEECNRSYNDKNFKRNEYYKCLECYCPQVKIATNNEFECCRCGSKKSKDSLIDALRASENFAKTHTIISHLILYHDIFTQENLDNMVEIALRNTQVRWVLNDGDINDFFDKVAKRCKGENVDKLQKILAEQIDVFE